jgi:hypothetical protein
MGAASPPETHPTAAPPRPPAAPPPRTSVVLAFLPSGLAPDSGGSRSSLEDRFERQLADVRGLSVAIMSATQGFYQAEQLLLDLTQGARVAASSYPNPQPPLLEVTRSGAGAIVEGWAAARRRAEDAPQLLRPGLLAARIPGGGAYAAISGGEDLDAVAAADRSGHIAALSPGPPQTLLGRVADLGERTRLVVTDLPGGEQGLEDLRALSERRPAGELLIAIQRARAPRGHELLWIAAGGLAGGGGKTLSSQATGERGLVDSIDIAPTILHHLGLTPIPPDMRGAPIHTDGTLDSASLRSLMARLHVIGPRRLQALAWLLGAWALLWLLASPWPRARAWAVRSGAIGVLWVPVAQLLPAAIEPSAGVEYATIAILCLALGALTDRLLPWPRAPLAPAIAAVLVLSVDALAGTELLMRSLLGPDPALGARFYGIGNELKSALAVIVLAAVAAAVYPSGGERRGSEQAPLDARGGGAVPPPGEGLSPDRRRRALRAIVGAGVLLAIVEGSAKIGAGVGGVILVSAGFAVAAIMLLPGAVTRRRALIVLAAPLVALAALAGIDLATAHGAGHYTGSILHASSAGEVRDVIVRRYRAAWDELKNHLMPFATALAVVLGLLGVRRRARLLEPVDGDPVWEAALAGGLAAGVVGALVEDSGPVLLVVAVFALACVLAYLWGRPATVAESREADVPHAVRDVKALA